MNTIERRVSQGLRAYGEGLDMTTQDIDRLEGQLELREQASRTQRRGKYWQGAVAACAVTGLVLGAIALRDDVDAKTQPAGTPPVKMEQLEGIWRVTDSDWLWRFGADGTMTLSNKPNLLTGVGTTPSATVRPAPGGFIAENDPDDPEGCSIVWAATISAEGRMRANEASPSAACASSLGAKPSLGPPEPWEFTRVSPVSVAGAATMPDRASSDPRPVTYPALLTGTWLLRGTGTLLTVDASADYALQDLGATDDPETGNVTVRPDGTVTFTPDTAPQCTAVYGSVTSTGTAMDTELATGSCNRLAATSDTWIRLN